MGNCISTCDVGARLCYCFVLVGVLSNYPARFLPFHLHAMDLGRGVVGGVQPPPPHFKPHNSLYMPVVKNSYNFVRGVGGYPLDLKKLKTYPVILYRRATWWGCNPCRSRLMGLFIQTIPLALRVTAAVRNIAEIRAEAHGLLVRLDWRRVGLGVGGVGRKGTVLQQNFYIPTSTEHCMSYTSVSQPLSDRGPVNSFFHKTRARSQQIYW